MPGKRITDQQVIKYKQARLTHGQEVAAAKTGLSVRSARRVEQSAELPSQRLPERHWRTRSDPFDEVWDAEVVPLLEAAPALNAVTLLEELQRRHPGRFPAGQLRTLQRRMRRWRAVSGAEREVMFAQVHEPGHLGLSDFTEANALEVRVAGQPLEHRLYQFVLAYSGWRHAEVVLGGESFVALSAGLQNALWAAGGVPAEHRTDSLSAAFANLAEEGDLRARYEALCAHYGMRATRNNRGVSHENGAVETRHGSLKRMLEQDLLLRGGREFSDLEAYRAYVAEIVRRANARVGRAFAVERACLSALPPRRTAHFEELDARVTKFSTFSIGRVLYSVPSRLIGHRLKVRLFDDRLEAWLGDVRVLDCARVRAGDRRAAVVDYRHVLPALRRKPAALARWRLRDALWPRSEYARTWAALAERLPEARACKVMIALLALAADHGVEAQLAQRLDALLEAGALPEPETLAAELAAPRPQVMPAVLVQLPTLAAYDTMIGVLQ